MRFHWMSRGESFPNPKNLNLLCNNLNNHNIYSLLLTYHSNQPDNFMLSAMAADNNIKIKFMIAIRTYAISPEYLAMMCASYNLVFPNKIILNIASGDIKNDEDSVNNIVFFNEHLDTPEKRLPYTKEWVEKFIKISSKWHTPEIIMSGHSDYTKNMAKDFDAIHLSMLDMYLKDLKNPNRIVNKKQMVAMSLVIRDSYEDALDFVKNNSPVGTTIEAASSWTIFGTEEQVLNKLYELENSGVSDILITEYQNDSDIYRIFDLISQYNGS